MCQVKVGKILLKSAQRLKRKSKNVNDKQKHDIEKLIRTHLFHSPLDSEPPYLWYAGSTGSTP